MHEAALWPNCTRQCGLFLDDPSVPELQSELEKEELIWPEYRTFFGVDACRDAIIKGGANFRQAVQTIWTDGASANNQDSRFTRAGAGIWYGRAHPLNMSALLPGLLQSNQRAELFALLLACVRDPRPLDVRSDSMYVVSGVQSLLTQTSPDVSFGDHADLWQLVRDELRTRSTPVTVCWVKGHAKAVEIVRGRTTATDKEGNDGADELAVLGASSHQIPACILTAAALEEDSRRSQSTP